ncbi:hypothetical protein PTKIN_Ptkin07bG0019400 [Pterospermum kingtungense]
MGSCKEYSSSSLPQTPDQTQAESSPGFNSNTLLSNLYPGTGKEEESLVEGLKNVTFEGNIYGDNNNSSENLPVEWQNGENYQYPSKPPYVDCSFFLKTGKCKFGFNCKFNHPVGKGLQDEENNKEWTSRPKGQIECKYYRSTGGCKYGNACRYRHFNDDHVVAPPDVDSFSLPVEVDIKEKKENDGFAEQIGQVECKYYLTPGGCKYGKACRYRHSNEKSRYLEKSQMPPAELNFLGLPIRMMEKECPFYMRTGSCAFGTNCKFNHPDPTAADGSNNFSSDSSGFGYHSSWNYNGGSNAFPLSSKQMSLNHNSSYPHGTHLNSEWNGHQKKPSDPYFPPSTHNALRTSDISNLHQEQIQADEFPERPGQPECPYFMKTGYCKYKAACKFHHPKNQTSNPSGSYP